MKGTWDIENYERVNKSLFALQLDPENVLPISDNILDLQFYVRDEASDSFPDDFCVHLFIGKNYDRLKNPINLYRYGDDDKCDKYSVKVQLSDEKLQGNMSSLGLEEGLNNAILTDLELLNGKLGAAFLNDVINAVFYAFMI